MKSFISYTLLLFTFACAHQEASLSGVAMSVVLTLAALCIFMYYVFLEKYSSPFWSRKSYLFRKLLIALLLPSIANLYDINKIYTNSSVFYLYLVLIATFFLLIDDMQIYITNKFPLEDMPGGIDYFRHFPPRNPGDMSTLYVMFAAMFFMPFVAKFIHGA